MPSPIYALVGDDVLLQQETLRQILRALPAGVQRIDIDGESANLAEVLDELRSFALFGTGKAVVVRSADDFVSRFREQMEDYVESPSDSATLILRFSSLPSNQRIYKAIAKKGKIETCQPPKDLPAWIITRAKETYSASITPDAARLLADLIGDDLGRLDNELAKLCIITSKIGPEEISGTVPFQRERQMWDMTNALAAGNREDALIRWRQLLQSDSSAEFRAVTWLCIWLENCRKALALLKQGQNAFTIGQTLKIWPRDAAVKFVETAKALGAPGVARAVNLLTQVDFQSKTGVGNASANVERFILSI